MIKKHLLALINSVLARLRFEIKPSPFFIAYEID